ncbi:MAG: 3,4-dihydroxy-2-butanone-4-phosphate synthase [Rhodospirillaceae bacterium]|jgi:3,4-dihydroxy 2-butanone 4-phosphate synthase|nr:3,4-dihydroxy-2-butanone-4-phosphate synthase [Rhodospirillaceae bacterium]
MDLLSKKHNYLSRFGTSTQRVIRAIDQIKNSGGVIVIDDENRENEGDIIYSAETITTEQMTLLIRECSGIVCLVLTATRLKILGLPQMVENNTSAFGTPFSVSIEARNGVTTGVSANDRVTTIRTAISNENGPNSLVSPGHVFPLRAHPEGLLGRRGHTEAALELMFLAERTPASVLCEVMNRDGSMARLPQLVNFANRFQMPLVSIEDLISYKIRS